MTVMRQCSISGTLVQDQLYVLDTAVKVCVEVSRDGGGSYVVLFIGCLAAICNVQGVPKHTLGGEESIDKGRPIRVIIASARILLTHVNLVSRARRRTTHSVAAQMLAELHQLQQALATYSVSVVQLLLHLSTRHQLTLHHVLMCRAHLRMLLHLVRNRWLTRLRLRSLALNLRLLDLRLWWWLWALLLGGC
jgi:hypothetical protein